MRSNAAIGRVPPHGIFVSARWQTPNLVLLRLGPGGGRTSISVALPDHGEKQTLITNDLVLRIHAVERSIILLTRELNEMNRVTLTFTPLIRSTASTTDEDCRTVEVIEGLAICAGVRRRCPLYPDLTCKAYPTLAGCSTVRPSALLLY